MDVTNHVPDDGARLSFFHQDAGRTRGFLFDALLQNPTGAEISPRFLRPLSAVASRGDLNLLNAYESGQVINLSLVFLQAKL